jgi:hypothetical protein
MIISYYICPFQNLEDTSFHEESFAWWNKRSAGSSPSNQDTYRLQATVPYILRDDLIGVQDYW